MISNAVSRLTQSLGNLLDRLLIKFIQIIWVSDAFIAEPNLSLLGHSELIFSSEESGEFIALLMLVVVVVYSANGQHVKWV